MEIVARHIEEYIHRHTTPETDMLEELIRESEQAVEHTDMISGRLVGGLLRILVRLGRCRRVLEVGTFTGYSAVSMADALPGDGELITLEMNEKYREISDRFFSRQPYDKKIRQVMGLARDTIDGLEGMFDLIFIDADKNNYPLYFRMLKPKLKSGGILVADNVLWSGQVLDPVDDESRSIDTMNKLVRDDPDFECLMLPVRDGVLVAVKS